MNIRISHVDNPKAPHAPEGHIEIEINGEPVKIPKKGQTLIYVSNNLSFRSHTEYNKESNDT